MIEFRVPCVPVAQPRVKATTRGKHAAVYTPSTVKGHDGKSKPHPVVEFKATIRKVAAEAYSGPPLEGPLQLDLLILMPRLATMFWKTKPMPRTWHVSKPDKDNIEKAIMDALSKLVWRDDAQVCAGSVEKLYAAGDEQPGVMVTVKELAAV